MYHLVLHDVLLGDSFVARKVDRLWSGVGTGKQGKSQQKKVTEAIGINNMDVWIMLSSPLFKHHNNVSTMLLKKKFPLN